jgi:tripartite-type tricarboxylate transporter receptor subunit TctC
MVHVPFRGGGPALQAVMAGQVDILIDSLPVVQGAVRDGSIRGIAVTSAQRLPQFPDLPTVSESGLPGYETQNWFGIFAPRPHARARSWSGWRPRWSGSPAIPPASGACPTSA